MSLQITLTGQLAAQADGARAAATDLPGRQAPLVFAYLVAERDRPVPSEELAEAVWGGALPPTWRPALRGVVSKVRDFLDVLGLPATDALTSVSGCYRLELPADTAVDVLHMAGPTRGRGRDAGASAGAAGLVAGTIACARAGDGEAAERLAAALRPWAGHHLAAGPVYLGGYAAMLRANARPGDRERAQAYDGTAQAMARLLGLALPAG